MPKNRSKPKAVGPPENGRSYRTARCRPSGRPRHRRRRPAAASSPGRGATCRSTRCGSRACWSIEATVVRLGSIRGGEYPPSTPRWSRDRQAVSAGEDAITGRRADRRAGMGVGEPHPPGARRSICRRGDLSLGVHASDVTVAQVVGQDIDDIRPSRSRGLRTDQNGPDPRRNNRPAIIADAALSDDSKGQIKSLPSRLARGFVGGHNLRRQYKMADGALPRPNSWTCPSSPNSNDPRIVPLTAQTRQGWLSHSESVPDQARGNQSP